MMRGLKDIIPIIPNMLYRSPAEKVDRRFEIAEVFVTILFTVLHISIGNAK